MSGLGALGRLPACIAIGKHQNQHSNRQNRPSDEIEIDVLASRDIASEPGWSRRRRRKGKGRVCDDWWKDLSKLRGKE